MSYRVTNIPRHFFPRRLYATFDKSSSYKDAFNNVKAATKVTEPQVIKLPLYSSQQVDGKLNDDGIDWRVSYSGISDHDISAEQCEILSQPVDPNDIEIKNENLLYLPEIKYRRILSLAFGPGKWALVPRSDHFLVGAKTIARTYALIVNSKFVSEATGEQTFFKEADMVTAFEGCRSNALMRCCKDLNIASELWDPVFINKYRLSLKTKKPMVNPRNILRPIVAKKITPESGLMESIKMQTAPKTFNPNQSIVPKQVESQQIAPIRQNNVPLTGKQYVQSPTKIYGKMTMRPSPFENKKTILKPATNKVTSYKNRPV
ncbi:hypothetical protein ACO0OL_001475 [Hanseniaspora opuntiae]